MLLAALSLGASPRPSAAAIDWNAVALQQSQYPLPSPGPAAAATEPPADCVCCEITRTALQNYFEAQKPMGDLQMLNFDCEAELGKVLNFHSPTAAVRWGTLPSCKCARPAARPATRNFSIASPFICRCDCETRLAAMRTDNCTINRPDFSCPVCVPNPPPPPPPPPPLYSECKEVGSAPVGSVTWPISHFPHLPPQVPVPCCEAMMPQLLKFCYSFEPTDGWPNATKCEDPSHWDGGARRGRVSDKEPRLPSPHKAPPHHPPPPSSGAWLPPAAFELLTEKYAPPECGADGEKAMDANKVRTRLGPGASSGRPTADPPHSSRSSSSH